MVEQQQLEPVLDWLKGCRNQPVRIEKREIGDVDITHLELKDVSVSGQPASMYDDYIAPEEIVLHGSGSVDTGKATASLPGDRFEIALSADWHGSLEEAALRLTTGRAEYVITKGKAGLPH